MTPRMYLPLIVVGLICSCQTKKQPDSEKQQSKYPEIKLTSAAFAEGTMIPKRYTCDGENVSPALAWTPVPAVTKSLALICDDPDAPMGTWVHWVLFNIPKDTKELLANVPAQHSLPSRAIHGTNDFRKLGYGGPCPPSGTHRYFFNLYALDSKLELQPGVTKEELLKSMEGHVLAEGQLMGKYVR